jgi:hypothetical protein
VRRSPSTSPPLRVLRAAAVALRLGAAAALALSCEPRQDAPVAVAPSPASQANAGPSFACPSHIAHKGALANVATPPGWIAIAAPAQGSETLTCANLARREYAVAAGAGGGVDITEHTTAAREEAPLPFTIEPSRRNVREHLAGRRRALAVNGGFLVGFDAGEFGGALFWFNETGDKRVQLADVNIIGITELRVGVVALSGLAHMGMSEGKLLRVSRTRDTWSAAPWIDMHGAVEAFVRESSESMLVLSTTGLDRVTACGDVLRLATTNYDVLYPSSMAVDAKGVVYVGMRQFVTRFVPTSDGYREEWLTREDCPHLARKKFECACRR